MSGTERFLNLPPLDLVDFLRRSNIPRFSFIYDDGAGKLVSSHAELQPIADFVQEDKRDFQQHEGIFFQISEPHGILQGVFVHRTARGQAAGGVRFWNYDDLEMYLRDGLRLSRAMTQKIALAGLWWGGGKGVMARNPQVDCSDPGVREIVYKDFGRLCTRIRGCYVAAEDVGTTVADMANIFSTTRFTTCIPRSLGGSGNPSILTAKGVLRGIQAALEFSGAESLKGKIVAVQGMGNVGGALIRFLFQEGVAKIKAVDISADIVADFKKEFPPDRLEASLIEPDDDSIIGSDCDILSLNATGGMLNPATIPRIKARIVCGGANNQLEDAERDDALLHQRGITYIPDFLTNRMGIVNCANEQYGVMDENAYIERHLGKSWDHSIRNTVFKMLHASKETGEPPNKIATDMADRLSLEEHPIFGHRGKEIIGCLAKERWFEREDV